MCSNNLLLLGFIFVIAVIHISYICQVFFIILDKSSFLPLVVDFGNTCLF